MATIGPLPIQSKRGRTLALARSKGGTAERKRACDTPIDPPKLDRPQEKRKPLSAQALIDFQVM